MVDNSAEYLFTAGQHYLRQIFQHPTDMTPRMRQPVSKTAMERGTVADKTKLSAAAGICDVAMASAIGECIYKLCVW